MKAYAIKNKEGKYKREDIIEYIWKGTTSYFSKDIRCADIFAEEEMAKCYCLKDCEVVEITIAEGDLEQELAIYKRALDLVCEDISLYEDITTPELKAKCYLDQAKKELEKESGDETTK